MRLLEETSQLLLTASQTRCNGNSGPMILLKKQLSIGCKIKIKTKVSAILNSRNMKTIAALSFCTILLLISGCQTEDERMMSNAELPAWLADQIQEDEAVIARDTTRLPNYGAWIRYEFRDTVYFEYDNLLSSLSRNPYSWAGVRIDLTQPPYTAYWEKRCCEQYVWSAPKYTMPE